MLPELSFCGIAMDEIGTYSLGYKLAMTVKIFSLMPLYMVWSSQMYTVAKEPDAGVVFGRMTTRILSAVLFVGLGMGLFAREAIAILAKPEFAPAAEIVAPILLVCLLQSAVMMMDAGFYLQHQTGLKLGVTLALTAVILVLYEWLIPLMGGMGAALATLGGFGFLFVSTLLTTQRLFPVRYEWGRLAALVGLCVGLWWIGHNLPTTWGGIAMKLGLLASVPIIVWWTGLIRESEKRQLLALVERTGAMLRRPPVVPEPVAIASERVALIESEFAQGGA